MTLAIEAKSIFYSPDGAKIRPSQDYHLPMTGVARLETLVARIKKNGLDGMIKPGELEDYSARIDAKNVVKALPAGITADDYYGINGLSLFTESATLTYTDQFQKTARAFDQPWLEDFIVDIWTPDELTHHLPFKKIALDLGAEETSLDKEIEEVQGREFTHGIGYSPAHITAFGMVQEYLTARWYQLTSNILHDASPVAAHMVDRVKQREGLHTTWYRDMTAIQIEENPGLIRHVAEALVRFQMPGNEIIPEIHSHSDKWLLDMGEDIEKVKRDIANLSYKVTNSPENAGRLLVDIAELQGIRIGPFNMDHVRAALDRLGPGGYGLVGEAAIQRFGLKGVFDDRGVPGSIRRLVRNQIAAKLPI